ncbi:MAG: hypothetical protein P8Z75_15010 [Gammaproteobacteria bacterium]
MSSNTTSQLPANIPAQLKQRVEALRDTGHFGGVISPHRALLTIPLRRREILPALGLALLLLIVYILALHWVAAGWTSILQWCLDLFGFHNVRLAYFGFSVGDFNVYTPYALLGAAVPTGGQWTASVILTAVILLVSLMLPDRFTPLAYLLRAIIIIQAIAIVYFTFWSAHFPYNLAGYHALMMLAGMAFIGIVPIVYFLTYYIFNVSLWEKLVFTLLTMLYLYLVIPLQYFAQLYLIHTFSLLYMPVLFLIFGLMTDVFLLIALYSWAMSRYSTYHPRSSEQASSHFSTP